LKKGRKGEGQIPSRLIFSSLTISNSFEKRESLKKRLGNTVKRGKLSPNLRLINSPKRRAFNKKKRRRERWVDRFSLHSVLLALKMGNVWKRGRKKKGEGEGGILALTPHSSLANGIDGR